MSAYSSEIGFRGAWRPYQRRVLDNMESHLDGNSVHIVAAPGSGKTVLGLEIVLRLGKPALILAPTLTIRDQWVNRFTEFFLPENSPIPQYISKDIKKPALITISTYQALYCGIASSDEIDETEQEEPDSEAEEPNPDNDCLVLNGNKEELVEALRQACIGTLVVDEAHHLRNAWWQSLEAIRVGMGSPTIVALTATPPYDVSDVEWKRYNDLCGAVDAEISAPELVLEKNLCPHQDYVYLTVPTPEEQASIKTFRDEIDKLTTDLCTNEFYIASLENHPYLEAPRTHIEEILENAEFFSALTIFINHVRGKIPENLVEVLGVSGKKLPPLDTDWLEILLNGRLFEQDEELEDGLRDIKKEFSRIGAIERKRVYLTSTPKLDRLLVTSMSKLNSIAQIAENEYRVTGSDLRMVILTDFIRKSEMPSSPIDLKPIGRTGAVPIFEKLRREMKPKAKIGMLTGSLSIIPIEAQNRFNELCKEAGIKYSDIGSVPLAVDANYLRVSASGNAQSSLVQVITDLFSEGYIEVLIGTKSLLGEGWDAPAVNALIVASFVGSYMLSNQMRGRAIRTQSSNPDKTANIWHLVCVDPTSRRGGHDLSLLTRRFKAFVGVSIGKPVIESGIGRMEIPKAPITDYDIEQTNQRMIGSAQNRVALRSKWEESLFKNVVYKRMADSVRSQKSISPREYVFNNSLVHLFWQSLNWTGFILTHTKNTIPTLLHMGDGPGGQSFLAFGFALAGLTTIPACIKSVILAAKHWPLDWSIRQIGLALLRTQCDCKMITTPYQKLTVSCIKDDGSVSCALIGGTARESAVFADALQEILDPVDNPRFILERRMPLGIYSTHDYHAVPQAIGKKKEWAETFEIYWAKHVGPCNLFYTRTIEGRLILLKARESAMSASLAKTSERVSCWR